MNHPLPPAPFPLTEEGNLLLDVKNLIAQLRNGTRIVDDISFAIRAGETFALLGESGCGKSMTALSLLRLLPDGVVHAGGTAQLDGVELFGLREREMCGVRGGTAAMIFQEPALSLNPVLTVGQQIAEALALHQGLRGAAAQQRCAELLAQVGIPDAARRVAEYPFQFSGGMKQRAMIAMALAGQPKLLIADEPTTALDVTIQAQVLQLLRDTQEASGMSLLLITHGLGVVAEMAHRVGVMYAGQIVEQASRAQLFAKPLHPYTKNYLQRCPVRCGATSRWPPFRAACRRWAASRRGAVLRRAATARGRCAANKRPDGRCLRKGEGYDAICMEELRSEG